MKLRNSITAFTMTALLAAASAQANVKHMLGVWNGTGEVASLQGAPQGIYSVRMVDTLQPDDSVASSVTVKAPGSPDQKFGFVMRDTAHGFSMASKEGSGGGTCLEKGLCEVYFGDKKGDGLAMTLIMDAPNRFRILKTQLHRFKAVRFYLEKYVRAQTK